jgi:O-methyltransferase involved in polyketide biosynthesis
VKNGLDPSLPTFFIWEGNTMYLEREQIVRTLKGIQQNFNSVSITIDCISRNALEGKTNMPEADKIIDQFKSAGAPFKSGFNSEDIIQLSNEVCLDLVESTTLGQVAKDYSKKYIQIDEMQAQHSIFEQSIIFTLGKFN